MIKKTPDDPDVIISVAAYEEAGENFSEAARQIGVPRSTIQHHVNVALALWAECRKQKRQWLTATKRHENNELIRVFFEGLAETTDNLERKVGKEVMKAYLVS